MPLFGDIKLILKDSCSKEDLGPTAKDWHINSHSHASNYNRMHKIGRYHFYNFSLAFVTNRLISDPNRVG